MNYMTEIKLFNEWLETGDISSAAVTLWHALMYIASRSGWSRELHISISTLTARTKLSRSTVYREREVLRKNGLIEFDPNGGRQKSTYRICSFESRIASHTETQIGTQPDFASHTGTQLGTQTGLVSHSGTQPGTQTAPAEDENLDGSQGKTLEDSNSPDGLEAPTGSDGSPKSEKSPYISLYKDTYKGGCGGKKETGKPSKKQKPDFDLSFIGDPAWEVLVGLWLEYKCSRSESYKSDLSVKKFHTMLRNLSRGDPQTARQIIDKSIANNWAGIFELSNVDARPRGQPTTGQHIGQIKQPEDEERRQKLLDKFGGSKPETEK